jgi:hypothetical protein
MTNDSLARELIALTDADRDLQAGALSGDPAARLAHRRVTVRNADRLAEILDRHGWRLSPSTLPFTRPDQKSPLGRSQDE